MHVIFVTLDVRPDALAAFLALVAMNHGESRREPGNLRFDVLRDSDHPLRFHLYEVYRDAAAIAAHQATPHYARWKTEVPGLLSVPRTRSNAVIVHPEPWT